MRKIAILGPGCAKCHQLAANARAAAEAAGVVFEIKSITKVDQILKHGVLTTPALMIDGQVRVVGRVAGVEEIRAMLG